VTVERHHRAGAIAVVGLATCLIPASRVLRMSPMAALRQV
jgi:ABC-type antimicrobial peptide transport system permease subunit